MKNILGVMGGGAGDGEVVGDGGHIIPHLWQNERKQLLTKKKERKKAK